jgi:DNA-binding response OmpR family regulator
MSSHSDEILVLEDDPRYQYILALALSQAGFRVTTAMEAAKALVSARDRHFDLAIVDYHLPDYSGTDFISLLRDLDGYHDTPVILITAWPEELNLRHLCGDSSVLVLSKMRSVNDLVDTACRCLDAAGSAS